MHTMVGGGKRTRPRPPLLTLGAAFRQLEAEVPMDARAAVRERVAASRDRLTALSHRIHAHPELAFEEERAAAWCAEALDAAGSGPLHLALCAEYDCLPGIGHACGHNIIAAIAVGAGVAAARVADDVGLTVSVVGTPAEERGGGKILLLERGAFAGVHAAMMVHPAPVDVAEPATLAWWEFEVRYTGKSAHASAFPEFGINAADALTVAQTAIGLLRQHIRQGDRIHGIVTDGGDAPNVVPAHAAADYIVRARTLAELGEIRGKALRCFEAGALATGATLEVKPSGEPYAEVQHDAQLAAVYRRNAEALGRSFPDLGVLLERAAASTAMGNVSHALPSIHPMIGIASLPAVNHQPEFAAHCATAAADQAVADGALVLAWTALDVACDPALVARLCARGR